MIFLVQVSDGECATRMLVGSEANLQVTIDEAHDVVIWHDHVVVFVAQVVQQVHT